MSERVFFRKTSLVDYPEKVAAALFFTRCNMRCPWCHNGGLINGGAADNPELTPLDEALRHIEKRASVLGGVVLSGGEPALYPALAGLIAALKKLSLAVKLDTNGSRPDVLAALLNSGAPPDYIAMDIKCAPERYAALCAAPPATRNQLLESIALIRGAFEAGRIQAEFRSLALPRDSFTKADIRALAPLTGDVPWYIRPFRSGYCLDPAWNSESETPPAELKRLLGVQQEILKSVEPRNLPPAPAPPPPHSP